jgi:hypothetical protein
MNAVCSEIHTKHINALCGQITEFLNANLVVHTVTTELWYILIIALLKSTDAHFCNYINSKNRLKLHYTLRHVSVRAGTIFREFPSA